MTLRDILNDIYPLPEESVSKVEAVAEKISVKKNEIIIPTDTLCLDVFFVAKGILRAFSYADGKDITFWIGAEGAVAVSMQGYINNRPGYENIITLEDSVLYHITAPRLHALYNNDIHLANWGRRFAEKELLRTESYLIPQLFTTGRERYETFLNEHPDLLNRIPLENLASYLGLTPVSLSRIRGMMASR